MDKEFWHKKWNKNEIGFHLKEVHPLLQKYYSKIFSDSYSVFVPLCGKTLDMRYLFSQNKSVIGCELSTIAVNDFFEVEKNDGSLNVAIEETYKALEICKDSQSLKILVGDYFNLSTYSVNKCQSIYDRAALIALPEELRVLYVEHLRKILPKAKMLLITLDYDQSKMSGPPFSVEPLEIERLFSFAKIETLKRSDIIGNEERFKSKGIKHFYQTAYFIEW